MKKIILLIISIALVGTASLAFFARESSIDLQALPSANMVLTKEGFEPREVTIVQGGTVTFSNTTGKPYWPASNLHPTHTIYFEFDPLRPLNPNEEWSFTFERVGTHNLHDHIRSYFTGKIHVIEQ